MVSREALKEQFLNLGITVVDNILDKCVEICTLNKVEEEEFVEIWMAYSLSHLGGADPTLDTLAQMERKEFAKKEQETSKPSRKIEPSSHLVIYNVNNVDELQPEEILSVYNTTPKTKGRTAVLGYDRTPDQRRGVGRSPASMFSPASFSPSTATPSSKYGERTNAGSVVSTFGVVSSSATWCPAPGSLSPSLSILQQTPAKSLYMYLSLKTMGGVLDESLRSLGEVLLERNMLDEPESMHVPHAEQVVCLGRVCCDGDGRLNSGSVLLQGPSKIENKCVPINLSSAEQYSLFPGQVVAVLGNNPTGRHIMANKVFSNATPPPPSKVPSRTSTSGPLHIVIAAGPFSQRDTLLYQPLEDLVSYLREHQPHVAILLGPFVDATHEHILNGELAETFDALFEKIVDGIMVGLKGLSTQLVLVASARDAHHHMVYPTPPFVLRNKYPNLHLVGDPCLLDIDGLVMGFTTADILLHLGKEEISFPAMGSDRLGRLAGHLLAQRNFYPLYPPPLDMNIDLELWYEHAQLTVKPHMLVLPSDLRYFIKDIDGCVVVNPERLAKGNIGGNFVRLEICPSDEPQWSTDCIRGEVVKI